MSIMNTAKKAARALTVASAATLVTATPAMAWGHTAIDKTRNAAVVIGGVAAVAAAVRAVRRRSAPPAPRKHTLG